MEKILNDISQNLDFFILMFLRVSSLIISSPIFGRKNLPNTLKIGFCLLIAYVIYSSTADIKAIHYGSIIEFVLLCMKELLFGLVLGYVTTLFFSIVKTAGQVMDMQMGFGMVNVMDVQNNVKIPVTGNLLSIVMLLSFFSVNGHLKLIYIVKATFTNIPVGAVRLNPLIGLTTLEVFVLAFVLAINVALPMIAAGLLGEVLLGVIVRAIPQMNIFVVGIPLKIILGFMMLLLIIPIFVNFSGTLFDHMFESIDRMIMGLAG